MAPPPSAGPDSVTHSIRKGSITVSGDAQFKPGRSWRSNHEQTDYHLDILYRRKHGTQGGVISLGGIQIVVRWLDALV